MKTTRIIPLPLQPPIAPIALLLFMLYACNNRPVSTTAQYKYQRWRIEYAAHQPKNNYIVDTVIDPRQIEVENDIIIPVDSLNIFVTRNNIADTGSLFRHCKIDGKPCVWEAVSTHLLQGDALRIYRLMVDKDNFNEDTQTTILYCRQYGILIKASRRRDLIPHWYFRADNSSMESFVNSLLNDTLLFPPTPPPPK